MEPISIVIPVRIESKEREDNLRCVLKYLLQSAFIHIDLLEADKEQQFHFTPHDRVHYHFIQDSESVFYRTRYLNLLLKDALHPVVGVWDADALIPELQVVAAIEYIKKGCIMSFPYDGDFRFLGEQESQTIRNDIKTLQLSQGLPMLGRPSVGGAFLVNKTKYLEAGGENEGFYGWGPEDVERVKRMEILGLPIARARGSLYHLYHTRKPDTGVDNNIKYRHNQKVLLNTCRMSKAELTYALTNRIGVFFYLNNPVNV